MSVYRDFNAIVLNEMEDFRVLHGLSIASTNAIPSLQSIVFRNSSVVLDFSLDVQDGYFDCRFGPVSDIQPSGIPTLAEYENYGSVRSILTKQAVNLPTGAAILYTQTCLTEGIRRLVQGIRDHEALIFR